MDMFLEELSAFQQAFDRSFATYLDQQKKQSLTLSEDLAPVLEALEDFALRPGKRLRPFLVHWGARAAGLDKPELVFPVAAAAEMLHVFALAHDDVMDQSDVRRGAATVHRLLEEYHRSSGLRGSAPQFGLSGAILAGDIALALSDGLIDQSSLSPDQKTAVREIWNTMRQEVIQGQFLDILASHGRTPASETRIWQILSLKSGKYSLERPLHLGGAAAGATGHLMRFFTDFGIPLGRAFQIQDDILGVFGEPEVTGKPADSDIREGKSTLLMARAYETASPEQRDELEKAWGQQGASDEDIARAREIIQSTGAADAARQKASASAAEARRALDTVRLEPHCRNILLGLADFILLRQA